MSQIFAAFSEYLNFTKWVEIIFSYSNEHGPCQDFVQSQINISQISSIAKIIIRGKNIWPQCGSYCKEKVLGQKLRKRELFYGLCHLKLYQFFLVCSYKAEISLAICRIQSHFLFGGKECMYVHKTSQILLWFKKIFNKKLDGLFQF